MPVLAKWSMAIQMTGMGFARNKAVDTPPRQNKPNI